jgi:hypothetical protein
VRFRRHCSFELTQKSSKQLAAVDVTTLAVRTQLARIHMTRFGDLRRSTLSWPEQPDQGAPSPVPLLLMRRGVISNWKFFLNNEEWFGE